MASTYVNNLRLEEIGTGEQSGTWGDTTNTNLEIIGQAVAWGTRAIANASTDNITIADGALDADRCLGLKLTGGGQACTVSLLPNTSSKTWFMYNATNYTLTFTCGSGANVAILAGQTKVIATDGLGAGGVVHDLLTAVNLAGTTTVDDLTVSDTALVTGVLTTTAATVFNGGFAANDGSTISTADNTDTLSLISTDADASAGPNLRMYRNSGSPANADVLGVIDFEGRNNNSQDVIYAEILTQINDVTDGSEDGSYYINTMVAGAITNRMNLIPSETIFNEESKDLDFRVESNLDTHALFVDGAQSGAVGIGVIPEVWSSSLDFLQIGTAASFWGSANTSVAVVQSNAYFNASDAYKYINTDQAAQYLQVDGTHVFSSAVSGSADATVTFVESLKIDASGNIIIASTGGTLQTATAGTSNFRAGVNAGNSIASGGNYNVCVGDEAGTAITTGDNNVAVGQNALVANQSASNNTAVGTNSMSNHTQGVKNVGVGELSLVLSVNTNEQTAVGYEALRNSVGAGGGGGNTALGYASMRDTTTGVYNTSLGYAAGYDGVLTGNYNTFLGALAGRNLAGDEDNSTFLGYNSGSAMTSGEKNVILGSFTGNNSGLNINTADNNIVLSDGDGVPYAYAVKNTGTYANYQWVFGGNNIVGVGIGAETVNIGESANSGGFCLGLQSQDHAIRFIHLSNATTSDGVCGSIRLADNSTTYATSSDYRLKENVDYTWDATTRLKQLKPARFNWISDDTNTLIDGFIAHEVSSIVPEAISGAHNEVDEDGAAVMQGIDQSKIVPLLVKTIQELEARITALEGA